MKEVWVIKRLDWKHLLQRSRIRIFWRCGRIHFRAFGWWLRRRKGWVWNSKKV